MDFFLAMATAKVGFLAAWLATGYYFLRVVFMNSGSIPALNTFRPVLLQLVSYARHSHPYLGLVVYLLLPYHAYVMYLLFPLTVQTILGMVRMFAMTVMLLLGLMLWRNKGNLTLRRTHRVVMYFVLLTAVLHIIVRN
jgi:hypothetical protein